jgi:outer membrane lipoprotein carrier protein
MSLSLASTLLLLVLVGAAPAPQQSASPAAQEVAASLQRKYDAIKDFSTEFVHRHEGGVLRRVREERGTLQVKKPGKMRWEYEGAERKLFVSDGVRMYQYLPEEKRVTVSSVPEIDDSGVLFLAGRGSLTRDFNVSFGDSTADTWTLRLEPKTPQANYQWLEITAARQSYELRSFTVGEKEGGRSTFTFRNFRENPGLPDSRFEFSIPKGVEVTSAGPIKR